MKKNLAFFLCIFFLPFFSIAQCDPTSNNLRKIAIVIGVKSYLYAAPLTNPLNDANDIATSLKRLGFEVYTYLDTDLKTMKEAINNWGDKLENYDVALFYYSGHGAEVNGENFIFPTNSNPKTPTDLFYEAYPVKQVLGKMEFARAKTNILLLDACRTNPFTRNWTRDINTEGLAGMSAKGCFIGFGASPGHVSYDGDRRNGTYTEAILKNIVIPNLSIDQVFTRVNAEVRKLSDDKQVPFKNSSLSYDFCLSYAPSKIEESTSTSKTLTNNIKSLLLKINFGSTVEDVVTYETSGKRISHFDLLQQAGECKPSIIRYYLKNLDSCKTGREFRVFLENQNLNAFVSEHSYIVYFFKENKLTQVEIRLYASTSTFYSTLLDKLGQNMSLYPFYYKTQENENYFITGLEKGANLTHIAICNSDGVIACPNDWK